MPLDHRVVVVGGPTASGKSALALDIAVECNGVVINADSMQIYKDMPILSACPTAEDKAKVPHKLYEIYDASYNGTVVDWLDKAAVEIRNCWDEGKLPVVVGGTGMYLDYLIRGTNPVPEADPAVREEVRALGRSIGVRNIYQKLKEVDPKTAERIAPGDTTRVMRAYEVFLQTGTPLSVWHATPMIKKLPEAHFLKIKICPDKSELEVKCFQRFEVMVQKGALAEAVRLAERDLPPNLPAMKAIGVRELIAFSKGEISLEEAIELGKIKTRQYAKRQKTWFTHRFFADICLNECYVGQKNVINDVKKRL